LSASRVVEILRVTQIAVVETAPLLMSSDEVATEQLFCVDCQSIHAFSTVKSKRLVLNVQVSIQLLSKVNE
jgi:hypothetical protein